MSKNTRETVRTVGYGLAALCAVLVLAAGTRLLLDVVTRLDLAGQTNGAKLALDARLEELFAKAQRAAGDARLYEALHGESDPRETVEIVRREQGAPLMLLTDAEGVVRGGTPPFSERGDYRLHMTDWGSTVRFEGRGIAVAAEDRFLPLMLLGGFPIAREGMFEGAVFASELLDDDFARAFAATHMPRGGHAVFYGREQGVVSDSFDDPEHTRTVAQYFNAGSDFIASVTKPPVFEVVLGNHHYFVEHIVLAGVGRSPGGVLLLYPHRHTVANAGAVLIVLALVALWWARDGSRRFSGVPRNTRVLGAIFISFIAVMTSEFVMNRILVEFNQTPYLLHNATLALEPGYDAFAQNATHRIAIRLTTGGEAVNAAEVLLGFDPKMLSVEEVLMENSFCVFTVATEVDNKSGKVRVACGLPTPGFSGRGIVAELLLRPRAAGYAGITFEEGTMVLANDGFGTNVLRLSEGGGYTIIGDPRPGRRGELTLFSSSHPNQERWYSSRDLMLSWVGDPAEEYVYRVDREPLALASGGEVVKAESGKVKLASDGTWYAHVAPLRDGVLGPTSHYRVNVDSVPPNSPEIRASATRVRIGEVVRLAFSGEDAQSGIQHTFYVDFGNRIFLPVSSPLYLPLLREGIYEITVRIFDNAGNIGESKVVIRAQEPFWPFFR